MKADNSFWRELKQQRNNMTKQQYRTIKGQAVKGNMDAARRGMLRIQQRPANKSQPLKLKKQKKFSERKKDTTKRLPEQPKKFLAGRQP